MQHRPEWLRRWMIVKKPTEDAITPEQIKEIHQALVGRAVPITTWELQFMGRQRAEGLLNYLRTLPTSAELKRRQQRWGGQVTGGMGR